MNRLESLIDHYVTERIVNRSLKERKTERWTYEEGCMMRTLESITQIHASRQEWESLASLHKSGIAVLEEMKQQGEHDPRFLSSLVWKCFALAQKRNLTYFQSLQQFSTPLGEKLNQYRVSFLYLSPGDIGKKLKQGASLAVAGYSQDDIEGHIFHAGPHDRENCFVSYSDRDQVINLTKEYFSIGPRPGPGALIGEQPHFTTDFYPVYEFVLR